MKFCTVSLAIAAALLATGCSKGESGADEKAPSGADEKAPTSAEETAPSGADDAAGGGPEDTARRVLTAFKAKDTAALAATVATDRRDKLLASAAKMFEADDKKLAAMRAWDGETLEVRYAGSDARVHFGPADGRYAVLSLQKGDDGVWYWVNVQYSDAEDFASWGSTDPNAPRPACNGGGMHADKRALPGELASRGGVPEGAVACAGEDTDPKRFSFELGDGPEAAAKAWRGHLEGNGWKVEDTSDDSGFAFLAAKDDVSMRVFTSKSIKNRGWTTVTLD